MIQFSVRFTNRNNMLNALRSLLGDSTLTEVPSDGWYTPASGIPTYFNLYDAGPLDAPTGPGGWWLNVLYRGPETDFPPDFLTNKRVQNLVVFG